MNILNKIIMIMSGFDWLDWLGLAVVFLLMCLLAFLVWRRKNPKETGKTTAPTQSLMPPNRLLTVWRGFIHAIPWRLRSDALAVPFSVVLGEAGCGKTEIINHYGDWQGQDFRFHPSAINDPLLQIYQGAKALILEFSSALLYDTNPATYLAIKKLWQRLPTNPQAVVVIDASTLLAPDPEYLRLSGQALSGKLKVFSELERKPLPLVLALSHMEKVPGFVEFCLFLEQAGISLQIDFPEHDGINHLESCLEGFKLHLSRALVRCSSQDVLKIVVFLREAPRLLGILSEFLRQAGLEQGATLPPVVRLCLLSKQVHSFGCDPFALQPGFTVESPFKLDYHAKAALILLLTGVSYFGGSYFYQKSLLNKVLEGVKTVRTTPAELYPERISPLFLDFSLDLNKSAILSFQPNFFPDILAYTKHLLIREIRTYYLIPLLKLAQFEPDAIFSTNKILAILYATSDNEMGKLVLNEMQDKPTPYMIRYRIMITDYIRNNSHTNELDPVLNELSYTNPESYDKIHSNLLFLLQNFDIILTRQSIDESELKMLRLQVVELLKFIDVLNSHTHELMIMGWLRQNTNLDLNLESDQDAQVELRQKPLEQLLRLVGSLNLNDDATTACPSSASINQCLKKVQAVVEAKTDPAPLTMNFSLDKNNFSYSSTQWHDLIKRSRILMMLRNIVQSHKNNDGWIFFDSPSAYPDLELNATNDGETLFAGKARIDGRLSADAFAKDLKPTIMALSNIVAKLPVDANEKKRFNDFVMNNLRIYSDHYISAYLDYFRQFQVRINSVWALNYVLDQIQQPNSALLQALVQIKNNTALDLSGSADFQSFSQKLMVFRFIQRMMAEKDGAYPEFQKYQIIMSQLQNELNSKEPYLPKKSDGDSAALKGAITPMGRAAWGMLLNEETSYTRLVKSWLQNAGIPNNWQQPFLAPVQKVAELGTAEIKQTIDGLWFDIWNSNVVPLLGKFPFLPDAGKDKELVPEDLIKVFHPKQGAFWLTFQRYLSPLCSFSNGVWLKRYELSDSLALPAKTFERLNAVQKFTTSLWDGQGAPKPLQLAVKPGLMPVYDVKRMPNAPLVSLTYLRAGGVSVLGFNQQSTWQKLPLEWWTSQPVEVGMEFRKDSAPTQVYTSLTVADSQWNFFRLLQQGKSQGNSHYQWSVAHPDFPQQPLSLEFTFQSAPWAIFTNLAGS